MPGRSFRLIGDTFRLSTRTAERNYGASIPYLAIHRSLSKILLWRKRPRRGLANGGSLVAAAQYGTGWRTIQMRIFCMSERATERPGRTRYGKGKDRSI